jgi:hypothetical protein
MLIHAVCFCKLYDSWSIHAAPIRSAINGSSKVTHTTFYGNVTSSTQFL